MKAFRDGPGFVDESLLCEGTERECRRRGAEWLGRSNLRGCPTAQSDRGVFYYEPGKSYDEARAFELVP